MFSTSRNSNIRSDPWYLVSFCGKPEVFGGNHEFSIRFDQRVSDIEELEYKVRSLVSDTVLWKTRGFLGIHEFFHKG